MKSDLKILMLFLIVIFSSVNVNALPTVGVVFNESGKYAHLRTPILKGIKLYAKENESFKIKFIQANDDIDGQRSAVNKIIKHKIHYILGHNFSSMSLAFLKLMPTTYPHLYFTPLATSKRILIDSPNAFMLWPENGIQLDAINKFVRSKKNELKKVFYIVNSSEPYSSEMAEGLKTRLGDKGIKHKEFQYVNQKLNLFSMYQELINFDPDVVFFPVYSFDLMKILKYLIEKRAISQKTIFIAGDTMGRSSLVYNKLGELRNLLEGNIYFTNGWSKEIKTLGNKKFIQSFLKTYSEMPSAGAAGGYDSAHFLHQLLLSNQKHNLENAKRIVFKQKSDLTIGPVQMDQQRFLKRKVPLFKLGKSGYIYEGLY